MRVEEREQVSVGRREQRQARLVHAYTSHGVSVAASRDEQSSLRGARHLLGLRPQLTAFFTSAPIFFFGGGGQLLHREGRRPDGERRAADLDDVRVSR